MRVRRSSPKGIMPGRGFTVSAFHTKGQALSEVHPEIVARLTKMTLDWKDTLPTKVAPNCVSPKRGAGLSVLEEGVNRIVIQ